MAGAAEQNKKIALDFIETGFNQGRPADAAERYIGETYTQHNPMVEDGVEGFLTFATTWKRNFPNLRIDFKRIVADGDLVIVHSLLTGVAMPGDEGLDDPSYALVDVLRLEDGKIREHWDVIQRVPDQALHSSSMV
jgi:predicted SnoaL-like aldol condensation-catalyzing enzyme